MRTGMFLSSQNVIQLHLPQKRVQIDDHDVRFRKGLSEPVLDVLAEVRVDIVQIVNVCIWDARQR